MPSFQCRELLVKSEVFERQPATTVEESGDRTDEEYKRVYHVRAPSRFAREWQCHLPLKSQAARIHWTKNLAAHNNTNTESMIVGDAAER